MPMMALDLLSRGLGFGGAGVLPFSWNSKTAGKMPALPAAISLT